ncbi:MAG: GntR family transcriptional regulator [Erysipelotrichaceae bacterium]|jgi:GntR family transcriptional regulator|nr:GntR family transcriptional regulator [Erysipelotrichaceae bacterium]
MYHLSYADKNAIYQQIVDQTITYIHQGILEADQQMPAVRILASQLGINPNTVQKAYQILEEKGYIIPVPKKGSFVNDTSKIKQLFTQNCLEQLKQAIMDCKNAGISGKEMKELLNSCGVKL